MPDEKPEFGSTFYDLALPNSKHNNCFNHNLYFMFDDGYLTTNQYASFWVNTELPQKELVDVSDSQSPPSKWILAPRPFLVSILAKWKMKIVLPSFLYTGQTKKEITTKS